MKTYDVIQGTPEWDNLRAGIPTASRFSSILTPKTMEYSAASKTYAAELIAERMLGKPLESGFKQTIWTERGTDMEEDAWKWYEMQYDCETEACGFITTDGGRVGYSPDRIVYEGGEMVGLLEIKCRSAQHHMRRLLGLEQIAERTQTQGGLWVSDLPWIDVLAYNDVLPKKRERQTADEIFHTKLASAMDQFLADVDKAEARLVEMGEVIEESDEILWLLSQSIKEGASC